MGSLDLLRSHPVLFGLAGANFLGYMAHEVLPSTFVLYATYRYGWDERTMGLFLAGVGLCGMIVSGGLVQPIVRRFGERRTLLAGTALGAIGFATYGIAPTGAFIFLGLPFQALWGISAPAAQGLMTRQVDPSAQGRLQGANSSLRGVAGLFAPTLFTQVFAIFIDPHAPRHLPGAPLLLAASLLAGGFVLAWHATRAHR
jgi:DHA1 family tetracycline resistance protein-like MFS transporter